MRRDAETAEGLGIGDWNKKRDFFLSLGFKEGDFRIALRNELGSRGWRALMQMMNLEQMEAVREKISTLREHGLREAKCMELCRGVFSLEALRLGRNPGVRPVTSESIQGRIDTAFTIARDRYGFDRKGDAAKLISASMLVGQSNAECTHRAIDRFQAAKRRIVSERIPKWVPREGRKALLADPFILRLSSHDPGFIGHIARTEAMKRGFKRRRRRAKPA